MWIKHVVDKNPKIILLPIFKFYEQKLEEFNGNCPCPTEQHFYESVNQDVYTAVECGAVEESPSSLYDSIQNNTSDLISKLFTHQETQSKYGTNENATTMLDMPEPFQISCTNVLSSPTEGKL